MSVTCNRLLKVLYEGCPQACQLCIIAREYELGMASQRQWYGCPPDMAADVAMLTR